MIFTTVDLAARLSNSADQVTRLSVANGRRRRVADSRPRRFATLNPDAARELGERYEAGDTIAALAATFGIDRTTVQRHLAASGVTTRYRKLTMGDIEACTQRYNAGETTIEIAADLGVHKDTIRRHLIALGVQMRSGRFGERPITRP